MNRSIAMAFVGLALLAVISLLSAQVNDPNPHMGAMTTPSGGAGMHDMQAMHEAHNKLMEDISSHVEAADAALATNDVEKARRELAQAKTLIDQWRQMGPRHGATSMAAASDKLSNTKCPIMLLPVSEPIRPELTRQFKGTKVGFCCSSCPPQWDRLSDADKEAKLKAVGWTGPVQ